MTSHGLIIVGSGPAGVAAAESFREHEAATLVRILTADIDLPYARPPLSKEYLRGQTDDVSLHPAQWFADRAIEITRGAGSTGWTSSSARYSSARNAMRFDRLILACGAAPTAPPIPGGQRARLLRSLADARALREGADDADSAVVIGSGFIGCEAAASLALRGVPVTIVAPEPLPQEKRLGTAAAERLRDLVTETGAPAMSAE